MTQSALEHVGLSFPDENCEVPGSKAADAQAGVSSRGLVGAGWWTHFSEWKPWAVSCLLICLRTGCFLPVCNSVLWRFPSPSSLAEFEAGLFSSEGLHLSAPRWLLLLSNLHQRHCYQSRKITGPLRSNREQNMMANQGTAKICP